MGLYQPTVITPSSLNGTGVIDATMDMTVTFQINGTIPIFGWQFVIMENTVESRVLYTSDWRRTYIEAWDSVQEKYVKIPVYTYGKDINGNLTPTTDTISAADLAAAGIINNYAAGYKLKINQQYHTYPDPNSSSSIVAVTLPGVNSVFFQAVNIASFDDTISTQCGRYAIFNLRITNTPAGVSHDVYDPIICKRWQIGLQPLPEQNIVADSGEIYAPGDDTVHTNTVYGMLKNGASYALRRTAKLESGMQIDTGWENFTASWTDTAKSYIHLRVYYVRNTPALLVRLEIDEGYDESEISNLPDYWRWIITRTRVSDGVEETAAILPKGQTLLYDYGARNNTEYYYKAYCGLGAADGYCYRSNNVKMKYYWDWAIIEAEPETSYAYYIATHYYPNVMYHVKRVFKFQGNVESGNVTNDNKPSVQDNFTPFPTVQKSSRKGLSGTLKAWVGRVTNGEFSDSIEEINKIMDLSTSETVKFLRDRKGNIRMIEIGDPIRKETQDPYAEQPVAVEVPWVEVGDASESQIVSLLTDGMIARGDDIIDTDTAELTNLPGYNGYIGWTIDTEGEYMGSEISMDSNGNLVQTYDDSLEYAPATLEIVDGGLKVTTVVSEEE